MGIGEKFGGFRENNLRHPVEAVGEPGEVKKSRKTEGERSREAPVVTAIVLRHGETIKDKTNPRRGLTKEGEKQVEAAAERLIQQLDPRRDIIQLFDSGNYRANVTIMMIAEKLREAGFAFFEPIKLNKKTLRPERAGIETTDKPKSRAYKRLRQANIPEKFAKQLADPELHKKMNIPEDIEDKRVVAWFLSNFDGAEKAAEVADRVYEGMAKTQKQLPMLARQLSPEQRIVVLAAGNASMIDSVVTRATGVHPVDRGGETPNGEGFRVDFNLGEDPKVAVWGEKIEKELAK